MGDIYVENRGEQDQIPGSCNKGKSGTERRGLSPGVLPPSSARASPMRKPGPFRGRPPRQSPEGALAYSLYQQSLQGRSEEGAMRRSKGVTNQELQRSCYDSDCLPS